MTHPTLRSKITTKSAAIGGNATSALFDLSWTAMSCVCDQNRLCTSHVGPERSPSMSLPSVAEHVGSGINTPGFYIDTSLYSSIIAHDHESCIQLAASNLAYSCEHFDLNTICARLCFVATFDALILTSVVAPTTCKAILFTNHFLYICAFKQRQRISKSAYRSHGITNLYQPDQRLAEHIAAPDQTSKQSSPDCAG